MRAVLYRTTPRSIRRIRFTNCERPAVPDDSGPAGRHRAGTLTARSPLGAKVLKPVRSTSRNAGPATNPAANRQTPPKSSHLGPAKRSYSLERPFGGLLAAIHIIKAHRKLTGTNGTLAMALPLPSARSDPFYEALIASRASNPTGRMGDHLHR
jgi:hypothetical protein